MMYEEIREGGGFMKRDCNMKQRSICYIQLPVDNCRNYNDFITLWSTETTVVSKM